MKLVWKCDYCSDTNVDKDKIEEHETDCVFNPYNRHCYSCDYYYSEFGSDYCKVKSPKLYDVIEKFVKCTDWSNEKIRNQKLKKIKNIIDENS